MKFNSDWYLASGKERKGPYDLDHLASIISAEHPLLNCKVWNQGLTEWTRAHNVPELVLATKKYSEKNTSIKQWLLVANKKVDRQPQGPLSEIELEEKMLTGHLSSLSLLWKKGQKDWLSIDQIDELQRLRESVRKVIEEAGSGLDSPPPIPLFDATPDASDDANTSVPKNLNSDSIFIEKIDNKNFFEKSERLCNRILEIFRDSPSFELATIYATQLRKSIRVGDPIMLDTILNGVRIFLMDQAKPEASLLHPYMTLDNLTSACNDMIAIVNDPTLKKRIAISDRHCNFLGSSPLTSMTRMENILALNG